MNIALILAGGTGNRMGIDLPKQYIDVNGKTILEYSLEVFVNYEKIDKIHIVADTMWHKFIRESISLSDNKFSGFSIPGQNRQLSILNGLNDIKKFASDEDVVIVHDAVRPMVSEELISNILDSIVEHDGVLPVLPMKDTVYVSDNNKSVSSIIDRSSLFAGQAPEAFKIGKYYNANIKLLPDKILKINGSTEPAILDGMDMAIIDGDENNFKITTKTDLEKFQSMKRGAL